jgi:hypothetical protein
MKNTNKWIMLLATTLPLAACEEKEKPVSLVMPDGQSLTRESFADQTAAPGVVTFSTTGAWTSNVETATPTRETAPPDWIAIDPASGDRAGAYTVAIRLTPNLTGADRAARVTIACGGSAAEISVIQKHLKENGNEMTITDLVNMRENAYRQATGIFLQVDERYATLEARQDATADTPLLLDYWNASYDAIHHCNFLNETLEREQGTISGEERDRLAATALAHRAALYFYLKNAFGSVPVSIHAGIISPWEIPPATGKDVTDLVLSDLDLAIQFGGNQADTARLLAAACRVANGDFATAAYNLQGMTVDFVDVNSDGIINDNERPFNTMAARVHLLSAEVALEMGRGEDALRELNVVRAALGQTPLTPASMDDARAAIRAAFAGWDAGMKILNATRWGVTASWGDRALLPVPRQTVATSNK